MSKLPNFLIVGAAKSGTTSIANYLKQHPEVCVSSVKEPKYISSQFLENHYKGPGDKEVEAATIRSLEEYVSLFSKCKERCAVGEASADLLYYAEESIPLIKEKFGGDVKIIAILRNPIERAYSAYTHLVRDGRETLDFGEALNAEVERKEKGWEFIWHYKRAGEYYSKVSSFMNSFDNVRVYLYDDLVNDSRLMYGDMCRFLSVDDSFVPGDIGEKYNVSGIPRFAFMRTLLRTDNFAKSMARSIIPRSLRRPMNDWLFKANLERRPIALREKEYLSGYFMEDVLALSELLGRDLSHWLR